jgi:hypothetical protein
MTDKELSPPIEKKDWEYVLEKMNKYNRQFGFVDFDSNGKIEFYDSDPFIDGVHAMGVDLDIVKNIINSY